MSAVIVVLTPYEYFGLILVALVLAIAVFYLLIDFFRDIRGRR